MPDVYISRKGLIMKEVDEKFTQTELSELKIKLDKQEYLNKLKAEELEQEKLKREEMEERLSKIEELYNDLQKTFPETWAFNEPIDKGMLPPKKEVITKERRKELNDVWINNCKEGK